MVLKEINRILKIPKKKEIGEAFVFRVKTVQWDKDAKFFQDAFNEAHLSYSYTPDKDNEQVSFFFAAKAAEKLKSVIDYHLSHTKGITLSRLPDYEALSDALTPLSHDLEELRNPENHLYESMVITEPEVSVLLSEYLTDKQVDFEAFVTEGGHTEFVVNASVLEARVPDVAGIALELSQVQSNAQSQGILEKALPVENLSNHSISHSPDIPGFEVNYKPTPQKDRVIAERSLEALLPDNTLIPSRTQMLAK